MNLAKVKIISNLCKDGRRDDNLPHTIQTPYRIKLYQFSLKLRGVIVSHNALLIESKELMPLIKTTLLIKLTACVMCVHVT